MATVSTTLPSDGQTIDAADVNTPLNAIITQVNGNIDANNIADDAVTPAKWTNPYCFKAYDSGGTTLTDADIVKINLATELWDLNNNFASSTYTAPVAGIYHFDAQFWISGTVATGVIAFALIYVNGAEKVRGPASVPTSNGGFIVNADILLAAGDTVEFYGTQDSAGNEATATSEGRTWMSGHLVHAT